MIDKTAYSTTAWKRIQRIKDKDERKRIADWTSRIALGTNRQVAGIGDVLLAEQCEGEDFLPEPGEWVQEEAGDD